MLCVCVCVREIHHQLGAPDGWHGPPMAELRFRLMYNENCLLPAPFTWLKLYKLNVAECFL